MCQPGSDWSIAVIYEMKASNINARRSRGLTSDSLQNRRNFLRISGEHRRKRGEREARVACEGKSAKK